MRALCARNRKKLKKNKKIGLIKQISATNIT